MRVAVLGGTRFVGRAIVEELVAAGHEPLVVHRGTTEPDDMPPIEHLHVDRAELGSRRADIQAFRPDAAVDCLAMSGDDARAALAALPEAIRLLVLSSVDVYRAYTGVLQGVALEPLPLDEDSPVREERYPLREMEFPGAATYEKLDVEEAYLARGATVIRLPMVYGPHDGQRREEFILRRVRARRTRIPVGGGSFLWTRGHAADLAVGVRLALESDAAAGRVYNLGEDRTASIRGWVEQVLLAARSDAELVTVPDDRLPPDLQVTGAAAQHLLMSSERARAELGFRHRPAEEAVGLSVAWHLAHPPTMAAGDFYEDDAALEGS